MNLKLLLCSSLLILALPAKAESEIVLTNTTVVSSSASGYTVLVLKNIDPNATNRSFKVIRGTFAWNTNYPNDEVTMLGHYMLGSGAREGTNDTGFWIQFEHGYQQSDADGFDELFLNHATDYGTNRLFFVRANRTNINDNLVAFTSNFVRLYDIATPGDNRKFVEFGPSATTWTFKSMGFTNGIQLYGSGNLAQLVKYGTGPMGFQFTGFDYVAAPLFIGSGAGLTDLNYCLPNMTKAQRNAVAAPQIGQMIYQTDGLAPGLRVRTGNGWIRFRETVDP